MLSTERSAMMCSATCWLPHPATKPSASCVWEGLMTDMACSRHSSKYKPPEVHLRHSKRPRCASSTGTSQTVTACPTCCCCVCVSQPGCRWCHGAAGEWQGRCRAGSQLLPVPSTGPALSSIPSQVRATHTACPSPCAQCTVLLLAYNPAPYVTQPA
jgi:hypothetical protein